MFLFTLEVTKKYALVFINNKQKKTDWRAFLDILFFPISPQFSFLLLINLKALFVEC